MNQDTSVLVKKTRYGWKVYVPLGLGGLVTLIILAFMFRIEAGIIALVIGLGAGARVWFWALHQIKLNKYEQRRLEAETKKLEYEADIVKISRHFKETKGGVFVLSYEGETIGIEGFKPFVSASKEYGDVPMLPESTAPKYRNLLDIDFVHLLIVGPSGSGKSTAMCHLIDNSNAICYVLDPHKKQNENKGLIWPANSLVIGDGRDWQAIDNKLVELLGEMDKRYKPDAGNFGKILIFADEWLSILAKCPHAKEFFETIGSEARKVDIHLVIGTISQTVDDLGVSAAIRDNLTQVNLNQTWKDQNLAQITWSRGEKEMVELPGKYRARLLPSNLESKSVQDEPLPELDDGPTIYSPTQDELKVYELWVLDKSLRTIWEEVYGTSFGGNQANQLKEILAKFGV